MANCHGTSMQLSFRLTEMLKLLGFQSCPKQKLEHCLQSQPRKKKKEHVKCALEETCFCLELTNISMLSEACLFASMEIV